MPSHNRLGIYTPSTYAKSVVTTDEEPLTPAAWLSHTTWMASHQGQGPWFSINNLYGGPGSAINEVSPDESAYSDREAFWVFQNHGYTSTGLLPWDSRVKTLIESLNDAITTPQSDGNFTAYLNYVDTGLTTSEAHLDYYGAATYNKLVTIKAKYNQAAVFWKPQAIGA